MIIDEKNFGQVVELGLRLAGEYQKIERLDTRGLLFNKERGTVEIITRPAYAILSNLDIRIDVPKDKPFYNVVFRKWTEYPYGRPIEDYVERMKKDLKFVGRTQYNATNIMNIINKEMEKTSLLMTRFIFVQGFLPKGCAAITFKMEGGRPTYNIPGANVNFRISNNSTIPEEAIKPGVTYTCAMDKEGRDINLDVITKFGKTRAGMLVSDIRYDSKCLPSLNNLEIIHPELMECSNILETMDDEKITMPPIHLGAMLLFDILKLFLLPKTSKFNLHFQPNINDILLLESIPSDKEDVKIDVYMAPYDYYKEIQRG